MKPPERFPKTNGLLRLGLTGPSARTSAEASRLCGLKLASRRVGHQTSSRDAANDTCPCCRYMQGVEDYLSYRHAVAATHGVESTSDPLPHHRRDSIVRDVPTPSTRRVPRAGVSASIPPVGVDASTGRARREEDDVVEDSVLSGLRRRTSQPVASATCRPRGSLYECSTGGVDRHASTGRRRRRDPVVIATALWYFPLRAPSSRRCPG